MSLPPLIWSNRQTWRELVQAGKGYAGLVLNARGLDDFDTSQVVRRVEGPQYKWDVCAFDYIVNMKYLHPRSWVR
jgi:hypothetical protein